MQEQTASRTARRVAAHRLRFDRAPGRGRPELDEALARDVAGAADVEPGPMHEYLRARTAFFDAAVVDALEDGIRQVVVVGAGYDGRAWRYGGAPVRFFEVDHPATQTDKRERVARLSLPTDAVAFVAVDLGRDDLAAALLAAGLRSDRPSLGVVEGLCAYLPLAVVVRLFEALRRVAPEGSRCAVSVGVGDDGDPSRRARLAAFRARVAALGEPVRSELDAASARPLLARAGWAVGGGEPSAAALGLLLADAAPDGAAPPGDA